ncbi:MAG: zinc ribbon domain-containing protein, partial [Acidobacteria bacterium]|nr:zinc ribbon domain-containing protein [Acidobacteriota bacterium]
MSIIRFTQNHEDLSTDRGYQFKFFCDRCGNGYLSSFQTSVT